MSAIVRQNPSNNNERPVAQPASSDSRAIYRTLGDRDLAAARPATKDERPAVTLEPHWLAAIDVATD